MKELSISALNQLKPTQVIKYETVKDRFVTMYMNAHGKSEVEAESFYSVVSEQLVQKIIDDSYIMKSIGYSVFNCMLDIATWGLPVSGGNDALIYVIGGNVNQGTKDEPKWVRVMTVEQSVAGMEIANIKAGQLKRISDVTFVREGDTFKFITKDNKSMIEHEGNPFSGNKILGGYFLLTYPDNATEYKFIPYSRIEDLAGYSAKKNRGAANELYTKGDNGQADLGFLATKMKKQALKSLPQLCMAQYSLVSGADYQEGYEQRAAVGLDQEPALINNTQFTSPVNNEQEFNRIIEQPSVQQQAVQQPLFATMDDNEIF